MKEKLQENIKQAMKDRNQDLLLTLRSLMAEFKRIEVDTRKELTPEQCIDVVQKEIKKRRDALEFAQKASRQDLIDQNNAEIAILQGYLGEQLSDDQLREVIQKLVTGGADNVGKVMGALNKDYKGKFEGRRASELVKEVLG